MPHTAGTFPKLTRLLILLTGPLLAIACKPTSSTPQTGSDTEPFLVTEKRSMMGTEFEIQLYTINRAHALNAIDNAFAVADKINSACSDYSKDSAITQLSEADANIELPLNPVLQDVLVQALEIAELTDGAFDPTLGLLTRLWRQSKIHGSLPEQEQLNQALAASGHLNVMLSTDKKSITKLSPTLRFDLGGIAKGFAVDKMCDVLNYHEYTQFSVAAGGDIRVGDPPPNRTAWPLTLRHRDGHELPVEGFRNAAASTSGDLHQKVSIDGQNFSHLIDPATGLGLIDPPATTIITHSAMLSDALATAATVLPDEEAKPILTKFPILKVFRSHPAHLPNKEPDSNRQKASNLPPSNTH